MICSRDGPVGAVGDVVRDAAAEQPGVLQHHPGLRPQLVAGHVARYRPVERDAPAVDLVEAHQEVDQGRLSGARRADDRHGLARLDGQRQVLDQRHIRRVPEADIVELHPAANLRGHRRLGRVGILLVGVEQREDALRGGDAGLQQVGHAGYLGQRLAELPRVLDERLYAAQRQRALRPPGGPRPPPPGRSSGCR